MSDTPVPSAMEARTGSRTGRVLSGTRDVLRVGYRDPEHISERLTLYATAQLAEASREWAERSGGASPGASPDALAERLRQDSARVARVDGAVAGTPFFIALVPGYLNYLWQETRMLLRIAALYGHDPAAPRTAAEGLMLRGVRPTVEAAEAALEAVRDAPPAEKPTERRSLRTWYESGRRVLVFGGFLEPGEGKGPERSRLRAVAAFVVGGVIWATTWVLPVTFMIAMAWACEAHARKLGRDAIAHYGGEPWHDRGHGMRQAVRGIALTLSIAVPIAFVAYTNHVRNDVGINWLGALGALVALSLVIATAVAASRR